MTPSPTDTVRSVSRELRGRDMISITETGRVRRDARWTKRIAGSVVIALVAGLLLIAGVALGSDLRHRQAPAVAASTGQRKLRPGSTPAPGDRAPAVGHT